MSDGQVSRAPNLSEESAHPLSASQYLFAAAVRAWMDLSAFSPLTVSLEKDAVGRKKSGGAQKVQHLHPLLVR
jgi:hypothetical protein